jgi:hypothetical protein
LVAVQGVMKVKVHVVHRETGALHDDQCDSEKNNVVANTANTAVLQDVVAAFLFFGDDLLRVLGVAMMKSEVAQGRETRAHLQAYIDVTVTMSR